MSLTITKMPNGYFLFESSNQKKGAGLIDPKQTNDRIEFFDRRSESLLGSVLYSDITLMNGDTEITGLDSAEKVMDALASLDMYAATPLPE